MGEGADVRRAMDGPDLEHDKLIDFIEARIREEHARGSDASESSAKTSDFVEATGVNSQALSWMKSIVKKLPKKDGQQKAMDIISSLEAGLPLIKSHVAGQGTAEMFPDAVGDEEKAAAALNESTDAGEAETAPEDLNEELAQDTAEFDAAVEAATDGVVTPIDFGGEAAE
ncbi:MAG: hypothetical protein EP341_00350 [Sphingomonadales bacterium]|nr:MAG: hypothetical protein EP341_00350 [Sphingomonadales bacterium]